MAAQVENIKLDLKGVIAPVSLLKCKSLLKTMSKGDILTVYINDDDVAKDLKLIVERSDDLLLLMQREKNHTKIIIRRG